MRLYSDLSVYPDNASTMPDQTVEKTDSVKLESSAKVMR